MKQKSLFLIDKAVSPIYLFRFYALLFGFLVFTNFNSAIGQTNRNRLVNFTAEEIPVASALYKLSIECGYDISYDASDSSLQKLVSINLQDKFAFDIYREILANTNHSFKQIDNLIVIYKLDDTVKDNLNPENELSYIMPPENSFENETLYDTVYVNDTIFRTKTDTLLITKTDTLRLIDTVFIIKPSRDKIKQIKKNQNDLIRSRVPRKNGWSAEVFVSPIASNLSLCEENSPIRIRNFSIGADLSKIINKLNISVDIKLNHFANSFNNEYEILNGGYYQTDTLDIYYTIVDTDTSWYYVKDSSWLPVDNHQYSYNIKNRIGYLDIGLSATYDFLNFGRTRIYAGIGLNSGLLIYRSGTAIRNRDSEPQGVKFADLEFNEVVFSSQAKLGMKYQINKIVDFKMEAYYFQSFDNVVSNFPYDNKLKGFGLKFAILYYF